jgi:hypothetical protein
MADLFFADRGSAGLNIGDDLAAHGEIPDLEFCRQLILSQPATEAYFGEMLADVVLPAFHARNLSLKSAGNAWAEFE